MTSRNFRFCLLFTAAAALPGCMPQRPPPRSPDVTLPAQFRSLEEGPAREQAGSGRWWKAFGDATLDALIERALKASPDVAIAESRIAAARARSRGVRADLRPDLTLGSSVHREQLSENGLFGAATRSGAFPGLYSQYLTGIDVSWELDLFGAQDARRRSAQAGEALAASQRDAILLTLPAEVTRLYVEHLMLAQQMRSLQRSLDAAEQRVRLLAARHAQGDLSEQAVVTARMDAERFRAVLPPLAAARESIGHAMGSLTGAGQYVPLPEESPLLQAGWTIHASAATAGMPSDLLRRRPDIRGAEARFQGAVADHRYAIADQYPRFTLLGSLGVDALRSGDLLDAASKAWTLTRQLTLPVFDGGRRKSAKQLRQAELDEAVAGYRKAVMDALADVERSLLVYQAGQRALARQRLRLADSTRYLAAEQARYDLGDGSLDELMRAHLLHEDAFSAELDARRDALLSLVRLQKSLGGPAGA